ncbi:MAG: TrkH family potassium uptake protein [Paludibacteraceae bacterium]|nr:TrkH family potassium uptake protein [Paludibacteraceae bacterium]
MTKAFNWQQVIRILGVLLMVEALFMAIAAIVAYIYEENDFIAIVESAILTIGAGIGGVLLGGSNTKHIGTREGYLVVGLVWIVFSIFGMLPFRLSHYIPNLTDAFFETMSGFTTTGATILTDIEALPHGLLFWRSMMQWLGGMGIVVLSLAILPMFGAGMQLFAAEVPGITYDKLQPKITDTARRLWELYTLLTIICAILLYLGGMDVFDAICHSLTTLASGGYSTKNASIAYWSSPAIHYIIIFFMILAGTNFSLLYGALIRRQGKRLIQDEEFRTYTYSIIGISLVISIGLLYTRTFEGFSTIEKSFRDALFQTIATITTTGFSTSDYMAWHPILWLIILLAIPMGGTAGSTSGGIKTIRLHIMTKNILYEFKRVMHPKAILPVRVNRRLVSENTLSNTYVFLSIFLIITIASSIVLILCGISPSEAFGCSLASIANVGPALGGFGPSETYAVLPDFAKWVLSIVMLIGRLELFTILILFLPSFWRK